MATTRRQFLGRAASAAFLASFPYGRIDQIARPIARPVGTSGDAGAAAAGRGRPVGLPLEQHLLQGLATVTDNGTPVSVPPLHHAVVTATLEVAATARALHGARRVLESTLTEMEASGLLDFRPGGLGLAVGWGLPYFRLLPPALCEAMLPVDVVTSAATGSRTPALLDATAFASDPTGVRLDQNHVVFVLASDVQAHIDDAVSAIFSGPPGALMRVTSIRRGFVDGHQVGTGAQSLTKQMAMAAKVPGARKIPDSAELFLGFTSTQTAALGPSTIANLETLPGMTDQWPHGYFRNGTTMHLSHIFEDLESWYGVGYRQRASFSVSPTVRPHRNVQTIPQGLDQIASLDQVRAELGKYRFVGHSSSMQPVSRLSGTVTDNYGNVLAAGTPVPQRADFNTLDNPFSFSADPVADGMSSAPAAGVHFIAFMPTSASFARLRQAMDGQYGPDGELGFEAVHGPFNNILRTTHRQNFLVPPRARRSFPLAELLR